MPFSSFYKSQYGHVVRGKKEMHDYYCGCDFDINK